VDNLAAIIFSSSEARRKSPYFLLRSNFFPSFDATVFSSFLSSTVDFQPRRFSPFRPQPLPRASSDSFPLSFPLDTAVFLPSEALYGVVEAPCCFRRHCPLVDWVCLRPPFFPRRWYSPSPTLPPLAIGVLMLVYYIGIFFKTGRFRSLRSPRFVSCAKSFF